MRVRRYLLVLLGAGVGGWSGEALWFLLSKRRVYVQTYFKRVPFSPVWALAGGLSLVLARWLHGQRLGRKALAYYLVLNGFEYLAGALELRVRGARSWDYARNTRWHLHGHVDLPHSLTWMGLALLGDRVLAPRLGAFVWPPEAGGAAAERR